MVSSPAAADSVDELVWLTRHEGARDAQAELLGLAADGRTALFRNSTFVGEGEDGHFENEWLFGDTASGALTPAPRMATSMSDDATIVTSMPADGVAAVTNVETGWSRTLDGAATPFQRVTVSGDGSTVLLRADAECPPDIECTEDSFPLFVEPVEGGPRRRVGLAGWGFELISSDGGTVVYETSDGIQRDDGVTSTAIATGDDVFLLSASDDLSTVAYAVWTEDRSVTFLWRDGQTSPLGAGRAEVSDDGSAVVWQGTGGLHRRDVASGTDELVVPMPSVQMLALDVSADGQAVVYEAVSYQDPWEDSGDLMVRHPDSTTEKLCCDGMHVFRAARDVLMSGDGGSVVFTSPVQVVDGDPECCNDELLAWRADAEPQDLTVSLRDSVAWEGSRHDVPVKLNRAAEHAVTVRVEAVDHEDWTILREDVVIQPGEVWGYVPLVLWGDVEREEDETVTVRVVSVDGAELGDGTASLTIFDAPPPEVTVGDVRRHEWASAQYWKFPISVSGYARDVVVTLTTRDGGNPLTNAMAGVDYVATTASVTIPRLRNTGQLVVQVNGDVVPELDETFTVEVTDVTGAVIGDGVGLGTIKDDDPQVALPVPVRFV